MKMQQEKNNFIQRDAFVIEIKIHQKSTFWLPEIDSACYIFAFANIENVSQLVTEFAACWKKFQVHSCYIQGWFNFLSRLVQHLHSELAFSLNSQWDAGNSEHEDD